MKSLEPQNSDLTINYLLSLPAELRSQFLDSLTPKESDELLFGWQYWARPSQMLPPGDWQYWLILAGRGFGKTRTGAETVREWVKTCRYVNLIGATKDDARDIMVEGESGILAICPKSERPVYIGNKNLLRWPNGATSLVFSADEPERLRGKQHEKIWPDELAAWRYPEAWTQATLGLRLGRNPQAVITTTPKPSKLIKELKADPLTVITGGSTYENQANIAQFFINKIVKKYEGTRLGRQELYAIVLDDNPGALWKRDNLDALRVLKSPELVRVVVAIDPSATSGGDEAGIIVAGVASDGQGYVLDDLSLQASPHAWASAAIVAYNRHKADRIVAETNNGGEMVELTLRTVDQSIPYTGLHASRGKQTRAEPIAALYEQGKVHHVGNFASLEDELCEWVPGAASPNRLDALVWAFTALMLTEEEDYHGIVELSDRVEISAF
jgi:phage terminase large subunit-like protein